MTPEQFRRLALRLRGATEGSHQGHPDFRLGGKIFAALGYPDEAHGMVKLTPESQARWMRKESRTFLAAPGAWGRQGATLVRLPEARVRPVGAALRAAWDLAAPVKGKSLQKPMFFASREDFRAWLTRHHAEASELLVGFYRVGSGRGGPTYHEALDEALCFGWIDAVRGKIDKDRWTIRFTPRKKRSSWSAINVRRARALIAAGRMAPAGRVAFEGRTREQLLTHALERRAAKFSAAQLSAFRANERAWAYFQMRPPSYREPATFWVTSAKQEATRSRRLALLIACSERGTTIPAMTSKRKSPTDAGVAGRVNRKKVREGRGP